MAVYPGAQSFSIAQTWLSVAVPNEDIYAASWGCAEFNPARDPEDVHARKVIALLVRAVARRVGR